MRRWTCAWNSSLASKFFVVARRSQPVGAPCFFEVTCTQREEIDMSAKQWWVVKELVGVVIGDDTPVAKFDNFWEASDYVDEHPERKLYIEQEANNLSS